MLNFSAIVTELQILIAKKMGYLDQIEFETSSKMGKDTLNFVKHRVIQVDQLSLLRDQGELFITIESSNVNVTKMLKHWPNRSELPLLEVARVTLVEDADLEHVTQLSEAAEFTNSEMELKVIAGRRITVAAFLKLTEVFNINTCNLYGELDAALFDLPKFLEMKSVSFLLDYFPVEKILILKSKSISLGQWEPMQRMDFPEMPTTLNTFFKQWFRKEREIEWFKVSTRHQYAHEENIFADLPFSILREYEPRPKRVVAFTIDRGDKKLCIWVRDFRFVTAKEYTDPKEVLES